MVQVVHQFGQRLRDVRTRQGLRQRDLEKALMLRPGALSQYERGVREPGLGMLLAIADQLGVSVDYLLGRPLAEVESPAMRAARIAASRQEEQDA